MRAGSRSEFVDLLKPTAVWGAWGSNLGSFLEPPLQSCAAEPELLPWEHCPHVLGPHFVRSVLPSRSMIESCQRMFSGLLGFAQST